MGELTVRKGQRFPVVSVYDAPFARYAEAAGIDTLLVGDSLARLALGYGVKHRVDLADMIRHAAAVKRATRRAHIIVDVPSAYLTSDGDAVRAARELIGAGADGIKIEGGAAIVRRARALVAHQIPIVAHIRDGQDPGELERIGVYALVLDGLDPRHAEAITHAVSIPTIGIGSGPHCDGQVATLHAVLGLSDEGRPAMDPFAQLGTIATEALARYAGAVREGAFPFPT